MLLEGPGFAFCPAFAWSGEWKGCPPGGGFLIAPGIGGPPPAGFPPPGEAAPIS